MPKVAYQRRQERGERKPLRIKIKKDDLVRVIAGRDKGKTGKVLEVDRFARKVTVEGVMIVKRHTRSTGGTRSGCAAVQSTSTLPCNCSTSPLATSSTQSRSPVS